VKSYPTDRVRNILIVGHGGAGKTSLVEAVCHATGATNRIGRVEDGTTVTDFEPEETRKQISVSLAVAPVEYDGFKINLLDAPGYADFIGDVRSALPAADAVLFVVSAVEGVETQTEVVWTMAEELGLPGRSSSTSWTATGPRSPAAWTASRPPSARPARRCTCPSARSRTSAAWSACCRAGPHL
jgi:small GTP-binding protein